MTPQRATGGICALLGVAFIAAMTLTPQPGVPAHLPITCILCGDAAVQDIILNIILFVPFGLGLRLAGLRRTRAILIGLATTITVELLQLHVIAGRDTTLGDVLTNTLGTMLGVGLADTWRWWVFPAATAARRLMWAAATAWTLIVAATVWGVKRSLPDTTLWGQWRPELLRFEPFPGRVLTADAVGTPFPPGPRGGDTAFRQRLVADSSLVRATVITNSPTLLTAPILDLYDMHQTKIFLLSQHGQSLFFSMRTNAARVMLPDPTIELRNVFPMSPRARPDTLRLAGGFVHGALVLSAASTHRTLTRRVALTPGLGWSFLIPWGYALAGGTSILSMLWLGGLFIPLVYWGARAGRRVEAGAISLAAATLGLLVVPAALGGAPGPWTEWLGSGVGAVIGCWLASRSDRRAVDDECHETAAISRVLPHASTP